MNSDLLHLPEKYDLHDLPLLAMALSFEPYSVDLTFSFYDEASDEFLPFTLSFTEPQTFEGKEKITLGPSDCYSWKTEPVDKDLYQATFIFRPEENDCPEWELKLVFKNVLLKSVNEENARACEDYFLAQAEQFDL